ncbi:MAG: NADP-dependent malic enzyme [Alphaproteobacteria bacterium CG11_big_fil_rev_8_21_14_0_20_44_7]|nr:MAG: NADP-dependent malic enzyme [Alphaproteobacteria bacterium CG11_big_fil_rev_8_21_14_0_20_44_7]
MTGSKNRQRTHFEEEALRYHMRDGVPGKVALAPTKPLLTQRDLALAYSPGVAAPCLEIAEDPATAYDYTAKGNVVAVISNGTAVLGLGKLGALASKPVMEGKAVLFKRFADIDAVDIEVDTADVDEFINAVRYLGPSWGGINLEDIGAPECFIIEQRLKELMDIPIFHDDQHGTAIICAAGLINAADIKGCKIEDMTVVVNGAGAAGIACLDLMISMGVKNYYLCDRTGIIHKDRDDLNQWKSAYAVKTERRTLGEALEGADVFLGLSAKGAVTKEMVKGMAKNPIIFAMANPDPEITPEEVAEVRDDAIVATGRSDYNNQVNNVMGFPYIFRGALDVRATKINEEMKIAAAKALAKLAREDVPDEVAVAYQGRKMVYGPDYIIPTPFDPRLIYTIPIAVAKAAEKSGVAGKPIEDYDEYKKRLQGRLNPTANSMSLIFEQLHEKPKKVIFADGEEEKTIRAAMQWVNNGYGKAILVGREKKINETMDKLGFSETADREKLEITNASLSKKVDEYIDFLYDRLKRRGYLQRDVIRMVKNDRNTFSACMLSCGDGDTLITGLVRGYTRSLQDIMLVLDPKEEKTVFGMSMILAQNRTLFMSDTNVHEVPTAEQLADIACMTAAKARKFGHEPRVAILSYSNFGMPQLEKAERIREAVSILDSRKVDFEYDGEMAVDVALNPDLMKLYPFCRLSGPANILIMPNLHAANLSSKLLQQLSGGTVVGPVLEGLEKHAQIIPMGAKVSDILNAAALASI